MSIAITAVGMATAQGNALDLQQSGFLQQPASLPWKISEWLICHTSFCAVKNHSLSGAARWRVLLNTAMAEIAPDLERARKKYGDIPLIPASCNGRADTLEPAAWQGAFEHHHLFDNIAWDGPILPLVSGACVSGLQALYLASEYLKTGSAPAVLVAAVEILSQASHHNYESLRVLTDTPMSWQPGNPGFTPGEAAVLLLLEDTAAANGISPETVFLNVPQLGLDINGADGLAKSLQYQPSPDLIIGQGSGPLNIDERELAALDGAVDDAIPLTSALTHFGHCSGASGLLSVALAALSCRNGKSLPALLLPWQRAGGGRPLLNKSLSPETVLVVCRALGGAIATVTVSRHPLPDKLPSREKIAGHWLPGADKTALIHPFLRSIQEQALLNRPEVPPDLLLVFLEVPLMPPTRACFGERLLPSAVLEITPGFIARLIAGCWGFDGPAITLVGGNGEEAERLMRLEILSEKKGVEYVGIYGRGAQRHVRWSASATV